MKYAVSNQTEFEILDELFRSFPLKLQKSIVRLTLPAPDMIHGEVSKIILEEDLTIDIPLGKESSLEQFEPENYLGESFKYIFTDVSSNKAVILHFLFPLRSVKKINLL